MPPSMATARIWQTREYRQQPWSKLLGIVHGRSISRHNKNRKT